MWPTLIKLLPICLWPNDNQPEMCIGYCMFAIVLSPDPALLTEEGLVLFEQFLGFADNVVLFSGTPIRSPPCDFIM